MPDENPYAAPQTIGSKAESLPLAQDQGRQRFPDWDTARVTRLADYGHAIHQVTSLCLGILVFFALGLGASFWRANRIEDRAQILLLVGLILGPLALRVWWGFHRAGWMRHCGTFFDCLAAVAIIMLVLWGILQGFRGQIHVGLVICMLGLGGFLLLHLSASFLAHLHARELFGRNRVRQNDLVVEADYRRRYGIG